MAWFILEMRRMMKRFGKEKVGSNPSHSRGCSIWNACRLTEDPTRATGKHWSKSKTKVLWQCFGEKINLRWLFSCKYVHEQRRISKGGNIGKFFKCFIRLIYFTNLLKFDSNLLTRLSPNNYHRIFFGGVCPWKGLCLFITLYQWFSCSLQASSISITWKLTGSESSQAPTKTYWLRNAVDGAQDSDFKGPLCDSNAQWSLRATELYKAHTSLNCWFAKGQEVVGVIYDRCQIWHGNIF